MSLQNVHLGFLELPGVLTWLLLSPPGPSGGEHFQEMWGIPAEAEPAGLPGSGGQRLKVELHLWNELEKSEFGSFNPKDPQGVETWRAGIEMIHFSLNLSFN